MDPLTLLYLMLIDLYLTAGIMIAIGVAILLSTNITVFKRRVPMFVYVPVVVVLWLPILVFLVVFGKLTREEADAFQGLRTRDVYIGPLNHLVDRD